MITIGDSVWTKLMMLFIEATNPETGETIETVIPRRHHLIVTDVDEKEQTVSVELPHGFIATLDMEDVEV